MFKFRLASIMRLKDYNEQLCREEVAKCLELLNREIQKENLLKEQLEFVVMEIEKCQEGEIDLADLVYHQNYRIHIKDLLAEQRKQVIIRQSILEAAQQKLVEAMKEKKVLQKLKEKKYQEYQYEQNKKEQALQDEMANRK